MGAIFFRPPAKSLLRIDIRRNLPRDQSEREKLPQDFPITNLVTNPILRSVTDETIDLDQTGEQIRGIITDRHTVGAWPVLFDGLKQSFDCELPVVRVHDEQSIFNRI